MGDHPEAGWGLLAFCTLFFIVGGSLECGWIGALYGVASGGMFAYAKTKSDNEKEHGTNA